MRFSRLAPLSLVSLLALGSLASCSSDVADSASSTPASSGTATDDSTGATTSGTDSPSTTVAGALPKPEVEIPAELPTELVITDLVTGSGPEAVDGDTVVVHYVGVRSADGTEFDNSYDRGEPITVTLGAGQVITGWDEGLVGVQQGTRRQLDIPSDLAYGSAPQGNVIQAGDALTFVVDVVAVLPLTDPADEPQLTIEGTANVDALVIDDLVEGDGPEIELGQTAALHIIAFRADTGEQIASSWESGALQPVPYVEGQTLPGLFEGMAGVQAGTRRQLQVPYADAFGDVGNSEFGLPPTTDLVLVIDVFSIY
ncbi:MAG: FKBP-type peptidyl-prolyl cis-trans isomerase [Ilumatobacteraceae bacterium]